MQREEEDSFLIFSTEFFLFSLSNFLRRRRIGIKSLLLFLSVLWLALIGSCPQRKRERQREDVEVPCFLLSSSAEEEFSPIHLEREEKEREGVRVPFSLSLFAAVISPSDEREREREREMIMEASERAGCFQVTHSRVVVRRKQ